LNDPADLLPALDDSELVRLAQEVLDSLGGRGNIPHTLADDRRLEFIADGNY
jgi:hypothetical protein